MPSVTWPAHKPFQSVIVFAATITSNYVTAFQIPHSRLLEEGLSVGRVVQEQGQFVIVFPQTFTASISCGYNISETLHFAMPDWIPLGCHAVRVCSSTRFLFKCYLLTKESFNLLHKKIRRSMSESFLFTEWSESEWCKFANTFQLWQVWFLSK